MSLLHSLNLEMTASLRLKVIAGVCVILVTVIGVFTYWDTVGRIEFHLAREESKAFEFSNMVTKSIQYPMHDGEMQDVQAILETLYSMEDLEFVNLHDSEHTIRYSGSPDKIGVTTRSEIPKQALHSQQAVKALEDYEGKRILHYAVPVLNQRECFKCHGRNKEVLGVLAIGLPWGPVETRVASLRNRQIFLGIVSMSVVGFFLIKWMSRSVTRPIAQLTRLANHVSRGNLDARLNFGEPVKCWEILECAKTDCPAYGKAEIRCWYIDGTLFTGASAGKFPQKIDQCRTCKVYKLHGADEIVQLADAFSHMTANLKARSKELSKTYDFQRNLIEGSIDGIVATDKDGNIVLFNEGAEQVFGYASEEVIRKMEVADLYPPGQAKKVEEALYDSGYGGPGKLANYETTILNKQGQGISVWLSASVIYTKEDPVGTVSFLRDLTERKRLEKKVLESERLATVGQGIAYISHEIKNPLMLIGGFAQQILRKIDQLDKNQEKLEIIIKEVKRLEQFLSEVTDITKPSKPRKTMTSVNSVVEEIHSLLQQELKTHEVELHKSLDNGIPEVSLDPKQIKQVLINVMKNAIESMPEGGHLFVTTKLQEDSFTLSITDTGKGIAPQDLDTVFEPFMTTKKEGTGLGLAICRKIIEDHDGEISIESKLGSGTVCNIVLPVQTAA
jgi:PAS domain S-box-containing protein